MKAFKLSLLTGLLVAIFSGCGSWSKAPKEEAGDEKKNNWTEEEERLFTENGDNSLGIQPEEYDYAIVVGNPSMNLLQDDEAGDAGEEEVEEEEEEAEEADDEEADDEEADDEEADDEEREVQEPTESELKACSDHFGKEVIGLSISGSGYHTDIEDGDLIAVKMSGNKAAINILLTDGGDEGDEPASIEGICIIAAGNQPTASVVIDGVSVSNVYYSATGNGAAANFEVKDGSAIEAFAADLKGNAGALVVTGDGEYNCDNISVKGNATEPACGMDAVAVSTEEDGGADDDAADGGDEAE